jgi:formyl-CoA transferase
LSPQAANYRLTGQVKPRTGSRSTNSAPRNAYRCSDGHYVGLSGSIQKMAERLFRAIGRPDMVDDPRFRTNADRVAHMAETDAVVAGWTTTLGKMEVFALAKQHRIPLAPVRNVEEVAHDPHMHQRGMLEWIEHDEIGRIVVPNTPLRVHGAAKVPTMPSPKLGQHNDEIYRGLLAMSEAEFAELTGDGVI